MLGLLLVGLLAVPTSVRITDSTGENAVSVTAAGVAGTNALSIQGIAGGTPIPVVGSLTVTGTGDTVSTGAPTTFAANGTCTGSLLLAGEQGAGFQLQAGTLAATLTASYSMEVSGSNFTPTNFIDKSGAQITSLVVTSPNSLFQEGIVLVTGARRAQVCTTAYTSGSANGSAIAAFVQGGAAAAGGGGGTVTQGPAAAATAPWADELSDGTSFYVAAKTGQLPTVLDGSGFLKVHEQGTATVSGTVAATQSGTWTVQAAQSGTWNITNISGTISLPTGAATSALQSQISAQLPTTLDGSGFLKTHEQGTAAVSAASLPLPTGAATAAKQPALGTAGTASTDVITIQGIASMTPVKTDGSGVTQPVSGTITANVGTTGGLALDATLTGGTQRVKITDGTNNAAVKAASTAAGATDPAVVVTFSPNSPLPAGTAVIGHVIIDSGSTTAITGTVTIAGTVTANLGTLNGAALDASVTGLEVAQGSTTSVQKGILTQCAVTTSAPTYTTGQTSPCSMTTAGELRSIITSALPAGTNVLGAVTQSGAPWADNITQFGGNAVATGTGAGGSGIPRVTVSNDSQVKLWDGTNVATVRPGSSASATTDTAIVVSERDPVVLGAGAALVGKVGFDQTTVGTTNGISIAQIGANTVLTGNGTTGTGSMRVTIASDNTPFTIKLSDGTNTATVKAASTAPVTTDTALVMTQSPNPSPECTSFIAINQTTGTTVITGTAAQKIYICSIVLISATAQNVSVIEGTGTVCASGTPIGILGGTTASMAFAANGGLAQTTSRPFFKGRTAADNICVVQSGTGNVSGGIFYVSAP